MNAKKRRVARTTLLFFLVAAGGVLLLCARRTATRERLHLYQSPVLDAASGARLRLLLPGGWSVSHAHPDLNTAATSVRPIRHVYAMFRPAKPAVNWWSLPSLLKRFRPDPDAERAVEYGYVEVQVLPWSPTGKKPPPRGILHVSTLRLPGEPLIYDAYRTYLSPDGTRQLSIRYHRLDKAAFDRTHERIARSLRFE